MTPKQMIGICILIAIFSFTIGVIINDVPRLQIEEKVRPFEALTFFVVLIFGYWYQNHQRVNTITGASRQKMCEQVGVDIVHDINTIVCTIESLENGAVVQDAQKRRIHLKFKSISSNVGYLIESNEDKNGALLSAFNELKEAVINEDFSLNSFIVTLEYLKMINSKSILLTHKIRENLYTNS